MLVHVTWQPSKKQATPAGEVEVPDDLDNEEVTGYLEEQHRSTVKEWKPLTRRPDPPRPQPLACPQCGSDRSTEIGYVNYSCAGTLKVNAEGTAFTGDGELRTGEDYQPISLECLDCTTELQRLAANPFERPDPDALRARLAHERQQLAAEEQEHPSPGDLDYENPDETLPNLEELYPVEAYDAGVEAGIELATGAALRVICGTRAYLARHDWRLRLLDFARRELEQPGVRLIALRAGGEIEVASRLYPETAYATIEKMMDVACARQTRVLNETDANVYIARRHRDGIVILTYRHGILIDERDSAAAAVIP